MATSNHNTLLAGTRKGLLVFRKKNSGWQYDALHFSGQPVSMVLSDQNTGFWWAALDHGHWGTKLHFSPDEGKTWEETPAPAYPEGEWVREDVPAKLRYIWAMESGGSKRSGHLWVGTEPGGLFHSRDNGQSFQLVDNFWRFPYRETQWMGGGRDEAGIHSIVVMPDNPDHLFVGISVAGVFESTDGGLSWAARNKGMIADFLPDPYPEVGHDPHLLVNSPSNPKVFWNQNHCGIFRSTDGCANWQLISSEDRIAHFGFAIAVSETCDQTAWVAPAKSDGERIAIDGALVISRTEDGGKTWKHLRNGLPQQQVFDIVYRHALVVSGDTLFFGTTCGNLFLSEDGGESWQVLHNYLPMVYVLRFC